MATTEQGFGPDCCKNSVCHSYGHTVDRIREAVRLQWHTGRHQAHRQFERRDLEKTGRRVAEDLPLTVLWGAMGQKSTDVLSNSGINEDNVTY